MKKIDEENKKRVTTENNDNIISPNHYASDKVVRRINMETLQEQLSDPLLKISKAVFESMIEMYYRDGAMKGVVIPVTFEDKEFEVEVRMK